MAKMEKIHVDVTPHIAAVAQPGDTVLIGVNRTLTDEELEEFRERFADFSDVTGVHVALAENATSMVVIKGDQADRS